MGIILRTLGKAGAAVGAKVAEKAERTAVKVVARGAKRAAVKSYFRGGVVNKVVNGALIAGAKAGDAAAARADKRAAQKEAAKQARLNRHTSLGISKKNNKYSLDIFEDNDVSEEFTKKLNPYVEKANLLTKKAKPYFEKIYNNKITFLKHCTTFSETLSDIQGLPDVLKTKNRYSLNLKSINEFKDYIDKANEAFADKGLLYFVTLHGFNLDKLDDVKLNNRIHSDEDKLLKLDLVHEQDLKNAINYFRSIIGSYEKILRFANEYIETLEGYNETLERRIKKLKAKIQKNNDYLKVRKLVNSLYDSIHLLSDIIDIDLVIDCRINPCLLERMKRNII